MAAAISALATPLTATAALAASWPKRSPIAPRALVARSTASGGVCRAARRGAPKVGGGLGAASDDQAGLGCRAADVEGQARADAALGRESLAGKHTGDGTRLETGDGARAQLPGVDASAVRA